MLPTLECAREPVAREPLRRPRGSAVDARLCSRRHSAPTICNKGEPHSPPRRRVLLRPKIANPRSEVRREMDDAGASALHRSDRVRREAPARPATLHRTPKAREPCLSRRRREPLKRQVPRTRGPTGLGLRDLPTLPRQSQEGTAQAACGSAVHRNRTRRRFPAGAGLKRAGPTQPLFPLARRMRALSAGCVCARPSPLSAELSGARTPYPSRAGRLGRSPARRP